jgi:outer membrane protein TolC
MRRIVFLVLVAAGAITAQAQAQEHRVTIEDCYAWVRSNYPLIGQLELVERSEGYNLANAAKGWLPQVTFSAQASYQSDVTRLPFDGAQFGPLGIEIPTLSRDQYSARVEVGQTVWDGGAVGAARAGVRAAAEVERASTEVSLYALRERVNGLFFGILVAGEQLARLEILTRDLDTTIARIEALIGGGIAEAADADAIRVERLRAGQQRAALEATREAYIAMLATLTGRKIDAKTEFVIPAPHPAGERNSNSESSGAWLDENIRHTELQRPEVRRPELALFDAQIAGIEARQRSLDAAITPRLGVFATGGYGRPGLNMLADLFDTYYIVGARLSWNIGGLYTRRNDRRQILSDRRGVELRREAFLTNTDLDITLKNGDITRLRELVRYDDRIVALRQNVLHSSEAKMAGGTLSGSDLARDINALEAARQDRILHQMELLVAIYNLKFTTNN